MKGKDNAYFHKFQVHDGMAEGQSIFFYVFSLMSTQKALKGFILLWGVEAINFVNYAVLGFSTCVLPVFSLGTSKCPRR